MDELVAEGVGAVGDIEAAVELTMSAKRSATLCAAADGASLVAAGGA